MTDVSSVSPSSEERCGSPTHVTYVLKELMPWEKGCQRNTDWRMSSHFTQGCNRSGNGQGNKISEFYFEPGKIDIGRNVLEN